MKKVKISVEEKKIIKKYLSLEITNEIFEYSNNNTDLWIFDEEIIQRGMQLLEGISIAIDESPWDDPKSNINSESEKELNKLYNTTKDITTKNYIDMMLLVISIIKKYQ